MHRVVQDRAHFDWSTCGMSVEKEESTITKKWAVRKVAKGWVVKGNYARHARGWLREESERNSRGNTLPDVAWRSVKFVEKGCLPFIWSGNIRRTGLLCRGGNQALNGDRPTGRVRFQPHPCVFHLHFITRRLNWYFYVVVVCHHIRFISLENTETVNALVVDAVVSGAINAVKCCWLCCYCWSCFVFRLASSLDQSCSFEVLSANIYLSPYACEWCVLFALHSTK